MIRAKARHTVDWFFKNEEGKWAIIQLPNVLLLAWIVLLITNHLADNQPMKLLQNAVLFAWAYTEFISGDSYFRKSLGGVVLIITVSSFFM